MPLEMDHHALSSPGGSSYSSAQKVKTLDLLASVKVFDTLSAADLRLYLQLVKQECGCVDATEAAESLSARYGWECQSRLTDLAVAWDSLEETAGGTAGSPSSSSKVKTSPKKKRDEVEEAVVAPPPKPSRRVIRDDDDEDDEPPLIRASSSQPAPTSAAPPPLVGALGGSVVSNRLPIHIKASATSGAGRNVLLCQVDDRELSFTGDSGAVGRLSVTSNTIDLDIKGRQYKGTLLPGPTVLLLNLTKPVGLAAQAQHKPVARVEAICNEFCHLDFIKLDGLYSGGEVGFQIDSDDEPEPLADSKKRKSKKQDLNNASDDDQDDSKSKKIKKGVKISTVTSRKVTAKKKTKKPASGKGKK